MISLILDLVSLAAVLIGIGLVLSMQKHEVWRVRAVMSLFLAGWGFFALKILFKILYEVTGSRLLEEPLSVVYSTAVMLFFLGGLYLLTKDLRAKGLGKANAS
ncbi:MAG: hypothetical protein ABIB71_06850 [Candidatus Woesearchaeota archaeon]